MGEKREIEITVGKATFLVELNQTRTAEGLLAALPLRGDGDPWGEEIYFDVGVALLEENPKRCERYLKRISKYYLLDNRHHNLVHPLHRARDQKAGDLNFRIADAG